MIKEAFQAIEDYLAIGAVDQLPRAIPVKAKEMSHHEKLVSW